MCVGEWTCGCTVRAVEWKFGGTVCVVKENMDLLYESWGIGIWIYFECC